MTAVWDSPNWTPEGERVDMPTVLVTWVIERLEYGDEAEASEAASWDPNDYGPGQDCGCGVMWAGDDTCWNCDG